MTLRVIKVGGSLLDLPGLRGRLTDWLGQQTPGRNILIAGGGPLADVIRQADAVHHLGERASHWLCVRLLTVTARWLHELLPGAEFLEEFDVLVRRAAGEPAGCWVFAVEQFLREQEPQLPGARASRDWRTTSDTIAARLATAVTADELVLLKSVDLPAGQTLAEAAAAGLVDPRFPESLPACRFRWVNLRARGR